ncbi:hypothetical protein [Solitalea koreensis]|uniref:Tetratricopeptide repeat-containing protein n=1 Tax=Solitalea koreensis TaxID=543615 RepID=A0A521B014_9SPHI|nr:hypothetical protein [Solitalea koreensis]SMO40120.1 hypothetical protein SAMN06265350_101540 [Solitalea koreensis]
MANIKNEPVFELIKSMSKSEKRNFKLFATRLEGNQDAKFLSLFDAMDGVNEYDEDKILKKAPVKKVQLSNMKAHLYKQILISLRLMNVQHYPDLQLREQVDFAKILYNKGLYRQSLKVLDKAKTMAVELMQNTIALEIVEFEKMIESQYITRSISNRADMLTTETVGLNNAIQKANQFSNLALQLYGLYLKVGYVKNKKDLAFVQTFFEMNLPKYEIESLGFYEKMYLYQSYVWYNYIIQDFVACYRHAQRWVQLFNENPQMKKGMISFYLKAYNYLLESLFYLRHYAKFWEVLNELEDAIKRDQEFLDDNAEMLAQSCLLTNKMNQHFMEGTFTAGLKWLPEIKQFLIQNESRIDEHHVLVFYYKIACLYFGSGDNKNALIYLSKVISTRDADVRSDLQCFARILNLIANYEAGNDSNLEYQIKSVYRFLVKMNDLNKVQVEVINFLKNLGTIYEHELKTEFKNLHDKLVVFENHPYEKRPYLYLDIISWLESKIENKPVQEIIRKKFLNANR